MKKKDIHIDGTASFCLRRHIMACCKTGNEPADWSGDDPALKRERKGYWFTGFGTGPDTTMGALWGTALIVIASRDATCHPFGGNGSGADGQKCVNSDLWNETFFRDVGGYDCLSTNLLGDRMYAHNEGSSACMNAFAAYRAMPDYTGGAAYTCNCTGPLNDHAFLGEGGLRPSGVFNLMLTVSLLFIGFIQMPVGTYADFSDHKLRNWLRLSIIGGIANLGMMIIGQNYLWVVGTVFGALCAIFTEVQIPLRSSYMEVVGKDDATRGYLGAMRQFASYSAQVVYIIIVVGGLQTAAGVSDPIIEGMFEAGLCGVWFLISMPCILRMMREHPAQRKNDGQQNLCVLTFSELCKQWSALKKYPEAFKFLIAHMFANFGGPLFVTLVSTYVPSQLGISNGIMVAGLAAVVLVVGVPATLFLANLMKRNAVSFRLMWVIILVLNIFIGVVTPVVAREPGMVSYLLMAALPAFTGAFAISWFYSLGWPSFISLIPEEEVGAYNGIFGFVNSVVQPFGTLIYFAVVQSTNSHPLAWALTTAPLSGVALLVMLTVNFKKGKEAAGRATKDKAVISAQSHA